MWLRQKLREIKNKLWKTEPKQYCSECEQDHTETSFCSQCGACLFENHANLYKKLKCTKCGKVHDDRWVEVQIDFHY
jgi:hypothetical protein